jgi:glutamate-1-semialdehyde 2,1-aminomutase
MSRATHTSSNSEKVFNSASSFVTGGVNSSFRFRDPHPIYFRKASGSKVWDIDGNEYVDCLVGNGSCILGHADPKVVKAVKEQLDSGLTVSLESELSIQVANLLHEMIPSARSVKLSNTGTEAVMHAFQIVRGYTRKGKVVKTEGCYHGWQDEANLSVHPPVSLDKNGKRLSPADVSSRPVPESEGYAVSALDSVAVVPYNDSDAFERYAKENSDIAALIVEPILFNSGCIPPQPGYLQRLREITEKHGILLIFDEIVTGFRLAPGGAQEFYDVIPDISIFGKAIANGFPLSAVVGTEEIMKVTAPKTGVVGFAGTFNANQPSLAASKATLEQLRDGKVQKKLSEDTESLKRKFHESKNAAGVRARFQGVGGKFQVYFVEAEKVANYKEAAASDSKSYSIFSNAMVESGVLYHQSRFFHHGTARAHDTEDIEQIATAFRNGLDKVAKSK